MRNRGFEVVSRLEDADIRLPEVSTARAAGYDFFAYEDVEIPPSFRLTHEPGVPLPRWEIKPTLIKTGIKAYMNRDEALFLYNRSSNPKKLGLITANSVGVVDSDFYNNSDNEGEIGFLFYNLLPVSVTIHKGDKIGQGVFQKFLKSDFHNNSYGASVKRTGGFGSTGD